jgi:protein-tyrosine-phosphatase
VTAVPEVLFVRVRNAGRSQTAAALRQHHANGTVTVRSAGSAHRRLRTPASVPRIEDPDMPSRIRRR